MLPSNIHSRMVFPSITGDLILCVVSEGKSLIVMLVIAGILFTLVREKNGLRYGSFAKNHIQLIRLRGLVCRLPVLLVIPHWTDVLHHYKY